MFPRPSSTEIKINLERIARQAEEIRSRCGVSLIAVVKADAYGLGASDVVRALADIADGFCIFNLAEAISAKISQIAKKPIMCLRPEPDATGADFLAAGARPAVWTEERARNLRMSRPIVCFDTGMHRFAAPAEEFEAICAAGECDEAFTHAMRIEQVNQLIAARGNRPMRLHAAGSTLLSEPAAWLDAVRPGIALYRGTVRVATRLIEVHQSTGPAGYTGFVAPRFGIVPLGYAHGLRIGPCVVGGQRRRILEVGMQSAYVEIGPTDYERDEVVLLGDGLSEAEIAGSWKCSEHEVLLRMSRLNHFRA